MHHSNNYYTANWDAPKHIKTLITTRHAPSYGFNLATHVGDDLARVLQNRAQLNELLPSTPHWLNQIHSNKVIDLDMLRQSNITTVDGDASITRTPDVVSVVMTADCVPILLTDKSGSFVASIHAGRAGLYKNIIANTIRESKTSSEQILAYIGPAICQQHYEVSEEIYTEFTQSDMRMQEFFIKKSGSYDTQRINLTSLNTPKFNCDLVGIAKLQLTTLGVHPANIYLSQLCTYCNNDLFYSYRKEQNTGRFATLIWITK